MIRYLFVVFFISVSYFFGVFFYFTYQQCIDFSVLERYRARRPSIVLDDEGNEWTRFAIDRREPVALEQVPQRVIDAFIAAEDHHYWSHAGISLRGIVRSLVANCYYGKIVQGASTITQQLVKLLFFDARKTYGRKLKEQCYALLIERNFSKEHILQMYLNHVYFGCGIYGIEAAAQRFWSKHVWDLSLDEAALLAGIVKSPGRYCPLLYPLCAKKRRDVVLSSMRQRGFIGDLEMQEAKNVSTTVMHDIEAPFASHLREHLRSFLENLFDKELLYTGGLVVQTTLNQTMQWRAQHAFKRRIAALRRKIAPEIDGALVCMHTKTGEIKAFIGGFDFSASQFDRASYAKRQFGSIFKPFVYAVAINEGMHFAQTACDEPLAVSNLGIAWQPRNASRQHEGTMTLARALSHSNNIITIKTLLAIGIEKLVVLAKKLRLSGEIVPYPSLALGCVDGTLKEAAGMFNIFANKGVYVEPHYIKWVKDPYGTKIWKKQAESERVMSPQVSDQVAHVLGIGLSRIKKRYPNKWIGAEAIGKTGTTNECRTNWFCGATPDYTTALYVGFDDNRSMGKHVYAVATVFPIWLELYRYLPLVTKHFCYEPELKEALVHSRTGRVAEDLNDPLVFPLLVPQGV